MKYFLTPALLITFLLITQSSVAQDNVFDSLSNEIKIAKEPEEKVKQYQRLITYLINNNDPRVESYCNELYDYASKNNSKHGMALAVDDIGVSLINQSGDLEKAIMNFEEAKSLYLSEGKVSDAVRSMLNIGVAYERMGKFDLEGQVYEEAVKIAEASGDKDALHRAYAAMGKALGYAGKIDEAMMYFDKAAEILEELDQPFQKAQLLYTKGQIQSQFDPKSALITVEEADRIATELNETYFRLYVRNLLSNIYQRLGEYEKAITITGERLTDAIKFNDKVQILTCYNDLGIFYSNLGDDEMAMRQYNSALSLLDSLEFPMGRMITLGNLGKHYRSMGNCDSALVVFSESMALADSIGAATIKLDLWNEVGFCSLDKGELEKAKEYFEQTLVLNQGQDPSKDQYANLGLGRYHLAKGDYRRAIEYLRPAYNYAVEGSELVLQKDASAFLAECYKGIGAYKDALNWTETFMAASDSLRDEENLRKLTTSKLTAEFDREKEILALQQAQNEALLKAETQQTRTVAIAIGALALLGFGFFWNARRQNKVIATQNQQLEQLNRTKDRIFSIIGHDLRKPAIAFRGITQKVNYLLKKKDYETLERLGNEIEKDALSLNQLTDNLLSWALTQKDVMPYNPKAIEVAPLVEEQLSIFEKIAAEKNIILSAEIPVGLSVFADENALRAIIRNLVDNALKYTPEGGSVQIVAEESDEGGKIVVNDTGIGMPEEILHDIFLLKDGKSQQGTSGEKGTGLGLHLVHELVHLNKGEIKVASQLNKGTKFEILMPRQTQVA
ncbi:MAG: hypothetical protein CMN32_16090 [Saprospirales bacterium]|nr:hypothetical protein [Saprospirales bacterium]